MKWVYDTETYPNCFLLCARAENGEQVSFELSWQTNDIDLIRNWIDHLRATGGVMVGFNNLEFDYPVLHYILRNGISNPEFVYEYATAVLKSEDKFAFLVYPSDRFVPQIDLYKIHHFDNKARMTSLKALEFNMRMANISDLPFPVGTILNSSEIITLRNYCWNDVDATEAFMKESKEQIEFRELLAQQSDKDFLNYSDVKIGKTIFEQALTSVGIQCYEYGPDGRQPKQTKRVQIRLAECVPNYISFKNPQFNSIYEHFCKTVITQTKGAFADLSVDVDGLEFKFGTGGLHASVENQSFFASEDMMIYDIDVTSLYPSVAIENNYYPEHLGPTFVSVYQQLKDERLRHKKGTSENAMLKLALNGVYGASNDPFSIFYDPLFTMKITITGQLVIAMLAERLLNVPDVKIIQVNTDGITMFMPRARKETVGEICSEWEKLTRLALESVEYDVMAIADVNSYIARTIDGKVKRKGRYEYDLEWHQDASALVVPKVAEQVLLHNKPIAETVSNWPDFMDFMLRKKVNRGSRLVLIKNGVETPLENTQRYYVSIGGGEMVKIMPPLAKNPGVERRFAIEKGWTVQPCNNLSDMASPIDYRWYINEVEKLVLGVM